MVRVIWHKAASPPHTGGSMVFASWRQCAPHPTHASLGPSESTSQTAPRSVQPFLHSSRRRDHTRTLQWATAFPSKLLIRTGNLDPPSNTCFLGPLESTTQTASRSVQPFLQGSRSWQTDWQTDHATPSVTTGRIYVRSTAMRPNNNVRVCSLPNEKLSCCRHSLSTENCTLNYF